MGLMSSQVRQKDLIAQPMGMVSKWVLPQTLIYIVILPSNKYLWNITCQALSWTLWGIQRYLRHGSCSQVVQWGGRCGQVTDIDRWLQLASERYRWKYKFRRRGGDFGLWAPGKASRRKQRLSWGSQDKDGPDVELGEKVTPDRGNGVSQPRRQREHV